MSRYKQPYSLYKRGKYWYYRTYTPDGIRTTAKSTGQTSKAGARAYCDALFKRGELWTTKKTFYEYAVHFYDDNSPYVKDRVEPLAETYLKALRSQLKINLLPYFGKKELNDIKYTNLKEFRIFILNNSSVSNAIGAMSALKHILDNAFRDREITTNPFDYLEPIGTQKKTRDAFTFEEVIKLYNGIGSEFQNIILLMALTGTRISEAVGITSDDIKQGEGFLFIDLNKQYNLGHYKPLKNKLARSIPISEEITGLLNFNVTRVSALYREFTKIKNSFENADERNLCFHSLRHFFITNTKSKGLNNIKIEVIAGHSLKGIEKVYTNFKVEDLLEVIDWQRETYKKIKEASEVSPAPQ